jgi:hypothetical protein
MICQEVNARKPCYVAYFFSIVVTCWTSTTCVAQPGHVNGAPATVSGKIAGCAARRGGSKTSVPYRTSPAEIRFPLPRVAHRAAPKRKSPRSAKMSLFDPRWWEPSVITFVYESPGRAGLSIIARSPGNKNPRANLPAFALSVSSEVLPRKDWLAGGTDRSACLDS